MMATLGERLTQAREDKGATPSEAAAATRIKVQHIESMERGDFSGMAASAYARGFIKIYAEYLGLDPAPLIAEYTREHSPESPPAGLTTDRARAGEESQVTGSSLWDHLRGRGALQRIAVPVGVIVIVVLIVSQFVGGNEKSAAQAVDADMMSPAEPLYIAEPPPPYIQASEGPGSAP